MASVREKRIQKILQIKDRLTSKNITKKQIIGLFRELDEIPITYQLLKTTLIGKAVNKLKKHDDPIGKVASRIVDKWKKMASESIATPSTQVAANVTSNSKSEQLKTSRTPANVFGKVQGSHSERDNRSSNPDRRSSGIRHVKVDMPPIVNICPPVPAKKVKKAAPIDSGMNPATVKKYEMTPVFSGRKSHKLQVQSLFDLCMDVLCENIDYIYELGPAVSYDIIAPVLSRCSAKQLSHIEQYNPHLIDETDELWKIHCQRDFKGCEISGHDIWKNLYKAKTEEREDKFKRVTANIAASMAHKRQGMEKNKPTVISIPRKLHRGETKRRHVIPFKEGKSERLVNYDLVEYDSMRNFNYVGMMVNLDHCVISCAPN
ncbi:uncharacterized protein TRIADDRAFT_58942 [Trichoplax adhaerens]|uniref:TFIIS N-terminal domain-containing protein n=1 Tax=Trichoplax adhaerens TaxID=10228 RepID=B3S438_TRIAD|nr:hypothetical protein TRIADDRAFT_58942 [Trichoplax adhaerens]EDV22394.1 hypothetical protein TRIADDRAFT_58942 [Trichoplax adhaerens]|eukprot:XP_002114938.1 hypothetical protein TRIADDRAFT_58942 [Trichoplax adhaerens]